METRGFTIQRFMPTSTVWMMTGFFDDFDHVVFYGAGPCKYAAAAFSVAAPAATVDAIQPQTTLDPRITDWDDRYMKMRRTDFTSRYGYAPDMLDAAEQA